MEEERGDFLHTGGDPEIKVSRMRKVETSTTKEESVVTGETAGIKTQRRYKALCVWKLQLFDMVTMHMGMGSQRKLTQGVLKECEFKPPTELCSTIQQSEQKSDIKGFAFSRDLHDN